MLSAFAHRAARPLLALGLLAAPWLQAPAANADTTWNNYYIISKQSGKCLEVAGSSMANGAAIVQAECSLQSWDPILREGRAYEPLSPTFSFVDHHSGKCFDASLASLAFITPGVFQRTCAGTSSQLWEWLYPKNVNGRTYGPLVNGNNGFCLEAWGAQAHLARCTYGDNQLWLVGYAGIT